MKLKTARRFLSRNRWKLAGAYEYSLAPSFSRRANKARVALHGMAAMEKVFFTPQQRFTKMLGL